MDRAAVHRRKGNLDAAFADNERAIELDPKNSNAYLQRGNICSVRGQWRRRGATSIRRSRCGPTMYSPMWAEADPDAAWRTRQCDRRSDRAIAMDPNLPDAFANRGYARRRKGELEPRSRTSAARSHRPKTRTISSRAATPRWRADFDRAIADFDRALAIAPDHQRAQEFKRNALAAKTELGSSAVNRRPGRRAGFDRACPACRRTLSRLSRTSDLRPRPIC
jgi:tetratricopeptide (TPR) repeat protein